jgi:hypothetical protein
MQTPFQIGAANASEALEQAAHLVEREPDYYRSVDDVIESYAENAAQSEGVDEVTWSDMERGFISTLRKAGVTYTPHGFWGGWN